MSFTRMSESGSFTGNGTSQTITLGWEPALVWVGVAKASGGAASTRGFSFTHKGMPSGSTFYFRSSGVIYETTNGITLSSTGFSVGSEATHNANGQTIYWWAIRNGPNVEYGSYTGQQAAATNTSQIITTSRPPNNALLMVVSTGSRTGIRYGSMVANQLIFLTSTDLNSYSGYVNGFDFTSTSFSVSNDAPVYLNLSGETYYWVMIQNSDGSSDNTGSSFGSTRYYHFEVNTAANDTVITYGLPTRQMIYHTIAGPVFVVSWDPMPTDAAFFARNATTQRYTAASADNMPNRTSTGYDSGGLSNGNSQRVLCWHY